MAFTGKNFLKLPEIYIGPVPPNRTKQGLVSVLKNGIPKALLMRELWVRGT